MNTATSDSIPQEKPETISLESLGIALAITWFGLLLWSPVATSSISQGVLLSRDFEAQILRLIFLLMVTLTYLFVQFFPFILQKQRVKTVMFFCSVLISPFALLGNVFPFFEQLQLVFPVVRIASWACAGFSVAVIMLIWGYDMSVKKNYRQGLVNVSVSSIVSGAVFVIVSFLQTEVACYLIMVLPILMIIIWLVCLSSNPTGTNLSSGMQEVIKCPTVLTSVKATLGKSTPFFIFSYGFVMGVAGSIGTQELMSQYAFIYVGFATTAAGICMCILLRSDTIKISKPLFLRFLPFAVLCLFLLSIANEIEKIILLSAIFFVVVSYNVINTAYPKEQKTNAPRGEAFELFNCESRTADMAGSTLGWAVCILIYYILDTSLTPYFLFMVATVLVVITFVPVVSAEEKTKHEPDHKEALGSVLSDWEKACGMISEEYKLSERESEICLLLSRGRDRQYIHSLLFISPSTVRTHTYNIYQKMNIHGQQELIDVVEAEFLKQNTTIADNKND